MMEAVAVQARMTFAKTTLLSFAITPSSREYQGCLNEMLMRCASTTKASVEK
jgi:hypothetical protein